MNAYRAFHDLIVCLIKVLLSVLACAALYPLAAEVPPAVDAQTLARQQARAFAAMAGSTVASASMLGEGTLLVTTSFRRTDWSGTVTAHELDRDGRPQALRWDAEARLAARSAASRSIYTQTSDGQAVELLYHHLDAAQQAALGVNLPGVAPSSASAEDRVRWLRGDEVPGLRSRIPKAQPLAVRRLSDMVGAELRFVAGGHVSQANFRADPAQRRRADVVYIGSNGGMLHAFHAGTVRGVSTDSPPRAMGGKELFAYVPSELLLPGDGGNHAVINELMHPDYIHRLFVAGGVEVSDAYWGGRWGTALIGAMGVGGRTVFALDVTDPENFDASKVMWEFRYSDEPCRGDPAGLHGSTACQDVGYGITQPKVVRLPTGRWAVVFGNGYLSSEHKAKLFIVDLESGRLLHLVDTGAGGAATPNGLGPAAITDWPANDLALGRLYTGDLLGNLWRIEMPPGDGEPGVKRLLTATDAQGMPQPIIAEPALAARPGSADEIVVTFGTGGLFDIGKEVAGSHQVQTFYGVFDHREAPQIPVRRDQLLEQRVSSDETSRVLDDVVWAPGSLRLVTQHGLDASHKGWLLDLPGVGERVLAKPTFPSGTWQERVRFSTYIPGDGADEEGLRGFVMDIDLGNGGRSKKAVFVPSGSDAYGVAGGVGTTPVSGVGGTFARAPAGIRAVGAGIDHLYDGAGRKLMDGRNSAGPAGRQSWRQIR